MFNDKEKKFYLTSFLSEVAPETVANKQFIQMTKKSYCVPGCELCVRFQNLHPRAVEIDAQISNSRLKASYKKHSMIEVTKCVKCQPSLFENYSINTCCAASQEVCKSCDIISHRCTVCASGYEMKPNGVCEVSPTGKIHPEQSSQNGPENFPQNSFNSGLIANPDDYVSRSKIQQDLRAEQKDRESQAYANGSSESENLQSHGNSGKFNQGGNLTDPSNKTSAKIKIHRVRSGQIFA